MAREIIKNFSKIKFKRNNVIFIGLYEEGTVRRRVSIDRSGLDINEGKSLRKEELN